MPPISKIKKRDGSIVAFDQNKIAEAIFKAAKSVGGTDKNLAAKIANQVTAVLEVFFKAGSDVPSVEQIQDLVEKILIEGGHAKTAKAYILYRQKHQDLRNKKAKILGEEQNTKFSLNTLKLFEKNFLLKDKNGKAIEAPEKFLKRIVSYVGANQAEEVAEKLYQAFSNLEFLPHEVILKNAGLKNAFLVNHVYFKLEDSMESIFDCLQKALIVNQNGGSTEINFSALRAKGDTVNSTLGQASGPGAFMKIFETAFSATKQGTAKYAQNIFKLKINHPEILEVITGAASKSASLKIKLILTKDFIEAAEKNGYYDLINPRTGEKINELSAGSVLDIIMTNILSGSNLQLIFEDPKSTSENFGLITGYLNLSKFAQTKDLDWDKLKQTLSLAAAFLKQCAALNKLKGLNLKLKKIISLNGFADLLEKLGLTYNDEKSLALAQKLTEFIKTELQNQDITLSINNCPLIAEISQVTIGLEPKNDLTELKLADHLNMQTLFEKSSDWSLEKELPISTSAKTSQLKKTVIDSFKNRNKGLQFKLNHNTISAHQIFVEQTVMPLMENEKGQLKKSTLEEILPPPIIQELERVEKMVES